MNTQLSVIESGNGLSIDEQIEHNRQLKEFVARVLVDGVHYDLIPGTKKKSLLQEGARQLALHFNLATTGDVCVIQHAHEHREVRAKCEVSRHGSHICEREAVCSTFETKYRYRTETTGEAVPGDYWKKGKPADMLGGEDYFPRKVEGHWLIYHQIPVKNVPDNWHTVHIMAQKRAYVAAIITATAAGDLFAADPTDTDGETTTQRAARNQRRATRAPDEPSAESNDRRVVLLAKLEDVAQSGESALLEAWQELSEADRVIVGKEFGRIQKTARDIKPLADG